MEPSELLRYVTTALERLALRYFVTGSTATIFFGEPRFTNDIDIVVAWGGKDLGGDSAARSRGLRRGGLLVLRYGSRSVTEIAAGAVRRRQGAEGKVKVSESRAPVKRLVFSLRRNPRGSVAESTDFSRKYQGLQPVNPVDSAAATSAFSL